METKSVDHRDIKKLIEDIALIKKVLSINKEDPEGELTGWAKKQLEISRKTHLSKYTNHEEVKRKIFSKKWIIQ